MDWLKERFENNSVEYKIRKTNEAKGAIMIPTGVGKSGVMFEDIFWFMLHNSTHRKHAFVINAPILRLVGQSANDCLTAIKIIPELKFLVDSGKVMFFINSSDSGETYEDILSEIEISAYPFMDGKAKGFSAFLESDTAEFAIIASCNKSLGKIANCMTELKKDVEFHIYLDESHTLTIHKDIENSTADDDTPVTYVNFKELLKAQYVYALSATPDEEITLELNQYNGHKGEAGYFIIREKAQEHIKANHILQPKAYINDVPEGYELESGRCEQFMDMMKLENSNIFQKILLTVKTWSDVEELESQLMENGWKVFSTCAKLGMREDGKTMTDNVVEFINRVDSYEGDCFVIHIKQLTAGIDIKSLTGCIIYNTQHGDNENYRTYIQTIGRTLRMGKDERGMPIETRLKKYGYVLFLVPEDFNRKTTLGYFLNKYYALDTLNFVKGTHAWKSNGGSMTISVESLFENGELESVDDFFSIIEELKMNLEKYIKAEIKPMYDFAEAHNLPMDFIAKEIQRIKNEYCNSVRLCYKNYSINNFLENEELIKDITKIIDKCLGY